MELFGAVRFDLPKDIRLFSDIDKVDFTTLSDEVKDEIRRSADDALAYELVPLTATLYMRFAEDGNRAEFETIYHKRRDVILSLLLGGMCFGFDKYKRKLLDVVWAVLEETSWVIPAHNVSEGMKLLGKPLPDRFGNDILYIDLFSAVTGAVLSLTRLYAGGALDEISGGTVTKRLDYELDRRILTPFRLYEMRWSIWTLNNWVPWIVSNVLLTGAIIEKDSAVLHQIVSLSVAYLDRFAVGYGDDCGCNEGASYWGAAIGTLFDACEIIYDITGGEIDIFKKPSLKKACEFIADMCISEENNLYVNFADCGRLLYNDRNMIYRMGVRTESEKLKSQAGKLYASQIRAGRRIFIDRYFPYRALKSLLSPYAPSDNAAVENTDKTCFYPDMQAAVFRRGKFSAAIKGGHNNESHNHNDVGHFIVYYDDIPAIIDIGADEYKKDTFNQNRYTLRETQSLYHNLPEFGGVGERNGREFCASEFLFDGSSSVTVSYAGAYPLEAIVSECRRTFSVTEDSVSVRDDFSASSQAIFNYILCSDPKVCGDTVYAGNTALVFSGAEEIIPEIIDLKSSPKLAKDWIVECLWRLRVKPCGNALSLVIKGSGNE